MDFWAVIMKKESQVNNQSFLFRLKGGCLEELEKANYKLRFEIRNAKSKMFCYSMPADDLNLISREEYLDRCFT